MTKLHTRNDALYSFLPSFFLPSSSSFLPSFHSSIPISGQFSIHDPSRSMPQSIGTPDGPLAHCRPTIAAAAALPGGLRALPALRAVVIGVGLLGHAAAGRSGAGVSRGRRPSPSTGALHSPAPVRCAPLCGRPRGGRFCLRPQARAVRAVVVSVVPAHPPPLSLACPSCTARWPGRRRPPADCRRRCSGFVPGNSWRVPTASHQQTAGACAIIQRTAHMSPATLHPCPFAGPPATGPAAIS